jgi:hypothetical protein
MRCTSYLLRRLGRFVRINAIVTEDIEALIRMNVTANEDIETFYKNE